MNMKTIHTVNGMEGVKQEIFPVARTIGNIHNYNRVIRVGSAIVILPDTDRTKDATIQEVLKAMGIKMQNPQDIVQQEETLHKYAVTDRTGDYEGIWGLTEEQHRLMQKIINNDYLLDSDTRIELLDTESVIKI